MGLPYYFFEGLRIGELATGQRLRREALDRYGMASAWADVVPRDLIATQDLMGKTPSGKFGCMAGAKAVNGKDPRHIGYHPSHQHWQQVSELLWIGFDEADPPGPGDLRRVRMMRGEAVQLIGGEFVIPPVRRIDATGELPQVVTFRNGQPLGKIRPEYADLWDRTGELLDSVLGNDPLTVAEGLIHALRGLSLNYRIHEHEQNAFGFLDTENYNEVVKAMIDLPHMLRLLETKKEESNA